MHVIFIGSNFFTIFWPPHETDVWRFVFITIFYPDKTQQNGIFKSHWKLLMFMRES